MRTLKVAIQGIAASYHHEATRLYFKDDVDIIECNTFKNVCEQLAHNGIDYAVMAIENSIAGSILPNYNLIKDYKFFIIGETYLPIGLHLLANKNVSIEDIRYVESHPMALAQCTNFLSEHPEMVIVEGDDTASVAKRIRSENYRDRAAIAGPAAAALYNLEIVQPNIGDIEENYTRFLIIAKHNPFEDNGDKTTVRFELSDSPGLLSDVLGMIALNRANLTKIQSLPVNGKPNRYAFYLDMEWESAEEHVELLKIIDRMTRNFSVLGWYKRHRMVLDNLQMNKSVCLS